MYDLLLVTDHYFNKIPLSTLSRVFKQLHEGLVLYLSWKAQNIEVINRCFAKIHL